MSNWIIPSNSSKFDLAKFLSKHENVVDWKQSANFEVGDVVYIYCTKPEMRIRYKMMVVETNIPFSKSLKDEDCWTDKAEFKAGVENNKYFRMQLTCHIDSDELTITDLHTLGIKGWIQSPRKLSLDVVSYIEGSIKNKNSIMTKKTFIKIAFAALTLFGFNNANSQITIIEAPTEEVICNCAMGQQNLIRCVLNGDTTYAFQLCDMDGFIRTNEYTVKLGDYDQALAIMQSMVEYKGKNKDVVMLNNPSNNIAQVRKVLGSTMFFITDTEGIRGGELAQGWIPTMIKSIKKERDQ